MVAQEEEESVELETYTAEGEIEDDMGMMPTEPVDSVFGFGKTLLETPRAVSSISSEMIDALNINDIDDLVVVSPGAFTQSFFGVAGALDVRGTAGEVYFRGMRRLDNPGNYPTPLGATDRIDIVRGPSTPIMGPSKIGGYLNFVPKSARAETGQYLESPTGEITIQRGRWDRNVLTAEIGGPGTFAGKSFGYYVFAQTENSGSFYENTATDQNIYQASFNLDISDTQRIEFGGMYHEFDGNQVAGWNRLTQDLIDNGTYITGSPVGRDANGDGRISQQEYADCCAIFLFAPGVDISQLTLDEILGFVPEENRATILDTMSLVNPGVAQLDHSQVLVSEEDVLQNIAATFYFDYIYDSGSGFSLTNKLFYDAYDNLNENAYGFSQFHESYVIEEKLIAEFAFENNSLNGAIQLSPSIRYTNFEHGDDYSFEYFDRRDITQDSTALDKLLLATQIDRDYSEYYVGDYVDYGLGLMGDFKFKNGLAFTGGVRYDSIDLYSYTPEGVTASGEFDTADGNVSGSSWSFSVSYETPFGVTPYFTQASQLTLIAGQGAELTVGNVRGETAADDSNLQELGIKGSFLDGRLFAALAHYKQDRTDFNAQSAVTNESVETEGTEFEMRFLATENLTLSASITQIEVINLNTLEEGSRFTFLGADDFSSEIPPGAFYGGTVSGIVSGEAKKAGIPENSYSLVAQYNFWGNFSFVTSYFHADETPSGYTGSVILPAYDLINAGFAYNGDSWQVSTNFKNITNEKYYRSNFPNLFGSSVVLPEKPFSWDITATYKF